MSQESPFQSPYDQQQPYAQQPYGQPAAGLGSYQGLYQGQYLAPHRGGMILAFGIIAFVFFPVVFGPMAWIMGNNDLREMDAGRMDPSGRGHTEAGRLCGMIATIIAIAALVITFLIVLLFCGGMFAIGAAGAAGAAGAGS